MSIFKKIININNLILLSALFSLLLSFNELLELFGGFNKLVAHKGIISEKQINKDISLFDDRSSKEKDSIDVFSFRILYDTTKYTASWHPIALDNLLQVDDTIMFYTKPITTKLGNSVSDGESRVWNTHSPNEVFHLVSNKYPSPLIDYKNYLRVFKIMAAVWLLGFVLFLGWYYYRRSGKKSVLVFEY